MSDFVTALNKLWPNAQPNVRSGIASIYEKAFAKFDIDSPLVVAHFMAQLSHECGAGKIRRESMRYSAPRIMEIFGVGKHSAAVTQAEANRLAGDEVGLAERVYGLGNPKKARELGNIKPGDGFRFRGNGFLQLTGRDAHKRIGQLIGKDLEGNPDLLNDPAINFLAACCEFDQLNCPVSARADNIVQVTKKVNGGRNGLAERTVWLRKWKTQLDGVEATAWAPRAAELDEPPTLLSTRTGQLGTATGVAGGVATVAQIGTSISTISDKVTTVTDTISSGRDQIEQVKATVQVVKPFLGFDLYTWQIIGATASAVAVCGVIGILIYRYLKIRNQAE